jgi:hypothetical protein
MTAQDTRTKANEKRKDDREQLKDWYVRSLFITGSNLKASDVPQEIIDCKRVLIMLKRAIADRRKN